MGITQFNRKYELTIGDPDSTGIQINELNVRFTITKDLYGIPNLAEIDIFNLSQDSIAKISGSILNLAMVFKAGYTGNVKTIFSGYVNNMFHLREGPEFITRIYAKDGIRQTNSGFTTKTFAPGTSIQQIIETVVEDFPALIKGAIETIDGSALSSTTYAGATKDVLNRLATTYGFQWSFQNGALVIRSKDGADPDANAVVINRNTGMINSPTITEIGVDVQTLLNPDITPWRLIQVQSLTPDVQLGNLYFRKINRTLGNGFFRTNKVIHTGEYRGNPWYSTISARSFDVNAQAVTTPVAI